jgi:hypothetical protein
MEKKNAFAADLFTCMGDLTMLRALQKSEIRTRRVKG